MGKSAMSKVDVRFICYFISLANLVDGYWWSATETTTEPPMNAVTSQEFYFQDKILQYHFTIPGTKFCGPGNKSTHPDDLGNFRRVDICCRDHDNCFDTIVAGKYKYGLYNNAKFTKSHCSCDETFHHCLKDVGTAPAKVVGYFYFTFFHINCFKKDHPVIDCTKRRNRRCLEYKLNFSDTPVYQWFDNPFFRHWVDQFPEEMMNMSLLDLNMTVTTPINIFEQIELDNMTFMENSTVYNVTMTTNNTAPYFGSYLQSVYESISNYFYNWTYYFNRNKVEVTTVSSLGVSDNNFNEIDNFEDSTVDFYVLND